MPWRCERCPPDQAVRFARRSDRASPAAASSTASARRSSFSSPFTRNGAKVPQRPLRATCPPRRRARKKTCTSSRCDPMLRPRGWQRRRLQPSPCASTLRLDFRQRSDHSDRRDQRTEHVGMHERPAVLAKEGGEGRTGDVAELAALRPREQVRIEILRMSQHRGEPRIPHGDVLLHHALPLEGERHGSGARARPRRS